MIKTQRNYSFRLELKSTIGYYFFYYLPLLPFILVIRQVNNEKYLFTKGVYQSTNGYDLLVQYWALNLNTNYINLRR